MRLSLFIALMGLAALLSCKAMDDRSKIKDFNQGRALNQNDKYLDEVKKTHPKVVIIYIANDTYTKTFANSRKNFDYLVTTLKTEAERHRLMAERETDQTKISTYLSSADNLQRYALRIQEEDARFQESISNDIENLMQASCLNPGRGRNPSTIGGLAIFRNNDNEGIWGKDDRLRAHRSSLKWSVCKYRQNARNEIAERRMNKVTYTPDYPVNVQPFSSRENILEALSSVKEEFERTAEPGEKFRYILVIKSHGSKDKVIVPLLSRDLIGEKVTSEQIVKAVINSSKSAGGILDGSKMDNPILNSSKMDNPILASMPIITQIDLELMRQTNAARREIGVKKVDLLYDMASLTSMQFPLTVWYSCQSALEYALDIDNDIWILNDTIRNSVGNKTSIVDGREVHHINSYSNSRVDNAGLLYTTDLKGVSYNEINFGKLVDPTDKYMYVPDLQDAVKALMDDLQAKRSE